MAFGGFREGRLECRPTTNLCLPSTDLARPLPPLIQTAALWRAAFKGRPPLRRLRFGVASTGIAYVRNRCSGSADFRLLVRHSRFVLTVDCPQCAARVLPAAVVHAAQWGAGRCAAQRPSHARVRVVPQLLRRKTLASMPYGTTLLQEDAKSCRQYFGQRTANFADVDTRLRRQYSPPAAHCSR